MNGGGRPRDRITSKTEKVERVATEEKVRIEGLMYAMRYVVFSRIGIMIADQSHEFLRMHLVALRTCGILL